MFRTSLVALYVLIIGLACVYLECVHVRVGNRLHRLLGELDSARERLRSLEIRYNQLVGPDTLEKTTDRFFQSGGRDTLPGI